MPADSEVMLAGDTYRLVMGTSLGGPRGWKRAVRASDPSDPGLKSVFRWNLSGPIGLSREGADGELGVDYAIDIDTRFEQLLIPAAAANTVDLSSSDPATSVTTYAFFSPALVGAFAVDHVNGKGEQGGRLLFSRGQAVTVVNPSDMSVGGTVGKPAAVTSMVNWQGKVRIAYGDERDIDSVTAVSSSAFSTDSVSGERASVMTVGSDRLWLISQKSGEAGKAKFTLDAMQTFSNAFPINDTATPSTGIGTHGPYTIAASESGAASFTPEGKSVRLIESVKDFLSPDNGRSGDSLWGWYYQPTKLGLFAVIPSGLIANPIGPEAMMGFEGPIDGYPTVVKAWKDSLWVSYIATNGDTYILRGEFWPEVTPGTGQPRWYVFAKIANKTCRLIAGTALRTNPTLLVGSDDDLNYYTLAFRGREIEGSGYRFTTASGQWFGTTLTRGSNMHRNLRYGALYSDDCSANKTFQLAVSVDGGSYVNVGSAITTDGHHYLRPVSAGVPLTTVSGHEFKPRITSTNDSATNPPKLRGFLDMVFDERPETIVEHVYAVNLADGGKSVDQRLSDLYTLLTAHGTASRPMSFYPPGSGAGGARYGFIVGIEEISDIKGGGVVAAAVRIHEWDVS